MPFVFTDPDGRIGLIHYKPEQLSPEQRAAGVEVTDVPEPPEVGPGERAVPYLDGGQVVYQITSRELTDAEKVAALEDAVDTLILDSLGGF